MAQYVITTEELTEIADAIRSKTGGTSLLSPAQMAEEIADIEVADNRDVNGFVQRSIDAVASDTASTVAAYAFYNWGSLKSASLPAVTAVGAYAFYGCTSLSSANFGTLSSIGSNAFRNCSALRSIDLSSSTMSTIQDAAFYGSGITTLKLPRGKFVNLSSSNVFNGSPIGANGSGGTIYIPSNYRANYESNANWSGVFGNRNNSIVSY